MKGKKVLTKQALLRKPKGAFPILTGAFAKVDCLSCGSCCRGIEGIIVFGGDPNIKGLITRARELGATNDDLDIAANSIVIKARPGEDFCRFLDPDTNICAVYDVKPTVCRTFPIIPVPARLVDGSEIATMIITSACPPVKQARDSGFSAITTQDMEIPIHELLERPEDFLPEHLIAEMVSRARALQASGEDVLTLHFLFDSFVSAFQASENGEPWTLKNNGERANIFVADNRIVIFEII